MSATYIGKFKMKTILKAMAATAAFIVAPVAMAQDNGWYGDIGVSQYSVDDGDFDVSATMLQGRVGYDFNDYFGVEGELAYGISGDSVNSSDFGFTPNVSVDVDINNTAGVYGVLSTANTNGFEFFGRAGYVQAEVKGSADFFSVKSQGEGFAYGLGAKYYFDGVNGVRADFTSIDGDANNFSIGYARKF